MSLIILTIIVKSIIKKGGILSMSKNAGFRKDNYLNNKDTQSLISDSLKQYPVQDIIEVVEGTE